MDLTAKQKHELRKVYDTKFKPFEHGYGWDEYLEGFTEALRICGYRVEGHWDNQRWESCDVVKIEGKI